MELRFRVTERLMAFFILWALVLTLQWVSGAYQADFGGHPDEAAHYVTSVMAGDYVTRGFPAHPMAFAETYYAHYPRVAIGHFPPGYYILLGSWTVVFPETRASVLIFQSLITVALALVLFIILRKKFGFGWSIGGALFLVLLPVIQRFTARTMSDTALALICLWAAVDFIQFLDNPKMRRALVYGGLAAFAILIKQAGLLLAFLVPLSILLTWRPGLFKRLSLWLATLPVIAVCVPWVLATLGIFHEGIDGGWGLEYARTAAPWVAEQMFRSAGIVLILLSGIGYFHLSAIALKTRKPFEPYWAVMVALPLSVFFLFTLVPIGSVETRYLIPAIPPLIVLAIHGLSITGDRFVSLPTRWRKSVPVVLAVLLIVVDGVFLFKIPRTGSVGFTSIAHGILSRCEGPADVLISSDPNGEGALIAAFVVNDNRRPTHTVHRASKVLATSDWLGRKYEMIYESEAEIAQFLRDSTIQWVVVDKTIPKRVVVPHHLLLEKALADENSGFVRLKNVSVERPSHSIVGFASVYKRTTPQ